MNPVTLTLFREELIDIAMAISAAAHASFADDRNATAAAEHKLAARMWKAAGYDVPAQNHLALARMATQAAAEARAAAYADELEDA